MYAITRRTVRQFLVGASLSAFLVGAPLAAAAEEFSDAQKKEIGDVVRDYLLKNPKLLRELFAELERVETQERELAAKSGILETKDALFRSKYSHVAGNPEGDVTMVEFFDYNCGYCKRAFPDVQALIDGDKKLRVVIKEFPILGPGSLYAARAAIASKKQGKYWDFHAALMNARGAVDEARTLALAEEIGLDIDQLKKDMDAPEVREEIAEGQALASRMGINGTPSFVIDDTLIPGALGIEELRKQIAEVREAGGCKVC
ncbi:MAG: DsbA family protein [Hyphomicrobiales bacterium]